MADAPGRDPPYSPEAEAAVLGGVLIGSDDAAFRRAAALVDASMFFGAGNRTLWLAMQHLDAAGSAIDVITVGDVLAASKPPGSTTWRDITAALLDAVPTAANIEHHCGIVADNARRRAMIDACRLGMRDLHDADGAPAAEIAAELERRLRDSTDGGRIDSAVTVDWTRQPPSREWLAGSDAAGWLPAGRLSMLTGHGGGGKSAVGLQIAVSVAGRDGAEPGRVFPSTRPAESSDWDQGPVVNRAGPRAAAIVGWEDEGEEAERRIRRLAAAGFQAAASVEDRLRYLNAAEAGLGPIWAPSPDGSGHISTHGSLTADGRRLLGWLESIDDLALVVIDPLDSAFGCNENDRAVVKPFLAHLNHWAARTGAAVLLVAHPAKAAGESQKYSGSTAWRNGVRALWVMEYGKVLGHDAPGAGETEPTSVRLWLDKSNYGRDRIGCWLALHVRQEEKETTELAWREAVGPEESAQALAEAKKLRLPPQSGQPGRRPANRTEENAAALLDVMDVGESVPQPELMARTDWGKSRFRSALDRLERKGAVGVDRTLRTHVVTRYAE